MDAQGSQTIRVGNAALAAAFARAAASYWGEVFPRVGRHRERWRARAQQVPDEQLRRLVQASLAKRTNIEGAAAFAAFAPRRRRAAATLALSAFQAAYNLLDILGEQPSPDPVADGRLLHEALLYALDPDAPKRDWYELHPLRDDGGYLDALLGECRQALAQLPSFERVAPAAIEAAGRIVTFQSFNLSEAQGDHAALEHWALEATPPQTGLRWWETAAAAGSSLGVHVLLGAAARADLGGEEAAALSAAYFPWIGALHSLLDNLVDTHEDAAAGHRSFVGYYSDAAEMSERLGWLAERAMRAASELPGAARHRVLVTALIGNYISAPRVLDGGSGRQGGSGRRGAASRQAPDAQALRRRLLASAGLLAAPTMLVFRLRRLRLDSFG
jgi:tetraprenyl-beta-curcumene synthase